MNLMDKKWVEAQEKSMAYQGLVLYEALLDLRYEMEQLWLGRLIYRILDKMVQLQAWHQGAS